MRPDHVYPRSRFGGNLHPRPRTPLVLVLDRFRLCPGRRSAPLDRPERHKTSRSGIEHKPVKPEDLIEKPQPVSKTFAALDFRRWDLAIGVFA